MEFSTPANEHLRKKKKKKEKMKEAILQAGAL